MSLPELFTHQHITADGTICDMRIPGKPLDDVIWLKAQDWRKSFDESQHPRDEAGKFSSGGEYAPTNPVQALEVLRSPHGNRGFLDSIHALSRHAARLTDWTPLISRDTGHITLDHGELEANECACMRIKGFIADNLAKRMEKLGVTEDEAAAFNKDRGSVAFKRDETQLEMAAAEINSTWGMTSGDSNQLSLALQDMTAKRFGMEDYHDPLESRGKADPDLLSRVQQMQEAHGKLLNGYIDAVYQNTQDFLKEHGIEQMTVYRGIKSLKAGDDGLGELGIEHLPNGREVQFDSRAAYITDSHPVQLKPISSFAISAMGADHFAISPDHEGNAAQHSVIIG